MILGEAGEAFFVRQEEFVEDEEVKTMPKDIEARGKNDEIVQSDNQVLKGRPKSAHNGIL